MINELEYQALNARTLLQSERFEDALRKLNQILELDPNNSELLSLKLEALSGLGIQHKDVGFLRKLCWYRSSSPRAFYELSKAYERQGKHSGALLALAFGASVDSQGEVRKELSEKLNEAGFLSIKITFINTERVGHLCMEPDSWLRSRKLKALPRSVLHLFIIPERVANRFVLELLGRSLNIVENDFLHRLHCSRKKLLADEFFEFMPFDYLANSRSGRTWKESYIELMQIYRSTKSIVKLNQDDWERVWQLAEQQHIQKNMRTICLHVRDAAYLQQMSPGADFSHHEIRDMNISNYEGAIKLMLEEGYQVVRIGGHSNQYLDIAHPHYHDLTRMTNEQEREVIETALVSDCEFYIGTTSGPVSMAACFDRPILQLNAIPFVPAYSKVSRFIPKIFSDKNGNIIPFSELFKGVQVSNGGSKHDDLVDCREEKTLIRLGVNFIQNDEQDILESVVEFEKIIREGAYEKLTERQVSYKKSIPPTRWFGEAECLITDSFLRRHSQLFV